MVFLKLGMFIIIGDTATHTYIHAIFKEITYIQLLHVIYCIKEHNNNNNKIIYHDFLPTPRRGSHVKSDKTHTQSPRYTP